MRSMFADFIEIAITQTVNTATTIWNVSGVMRRDVQCRCAEHKRELEAQRVGRSGFAGGIELDARRLAQTNAAGADVVARATAARTGTSVTDGAIDRDRGTSMPVNVVDVPEGCGSRAEPRGAANVRAVPGRSSGTCSERLNILSSAPAWVCC